MIALALSALALAAPACRPPGSRSTRTEFRFTLSRTTLVAGPAIDPARDCGEDPHDLRFRRIGGTRTYRLPQVRPGGIAELETRLAPGRFRLWCSLPGHRARGMSATLLVRPA